MQSVIAAVQRLPSPCQPSLLIGNTSQFTLNIQIGIISFTLDVAILTVVDGHSIHNRRVYKHRRIQVPFNWYTELTKSLETDANRQNLATRCQLINYNNNSPGLLLPSTGLLQSLPSGSILDGVHPFIGCLSIFFFIFLGFFLYRGESIPLVSWSSVRRCICRRGLPIFIWVSYMWEQYILHLRKHLFCSFTFSLRC